MSEAKVSNSRQWAIGKKAMGKATDCDLKPRTSNFEP